jgi:hypothetical protein
LNTFVVGKMYSRYRRGCCFLSTFFFPQCVTKCVYK